MIIHCILTVGIDRAEQGMQMIESLQGQDVDLHVLWRGFGGISPKMPFVPTTELHINQASLSRSRNILLENLFSANNIESKDVICFADDDGLWPADLAKNIRQIFDQELNWAIGCFGPSIELMNLRRFPAADSKLTSVEQLLRKAASINLYIRANIVKEIGKFDEGLGVGTETPIGEDVEYAVRVYNLLSNAPYFYQLRQIHPYKESNKSRTHQLNLVLLLVIQMRYGGVLFPLCKKIIRLFLEDSKELLNLKLYLRQAQEICNLGGVNIQF